MDLSQGSSGFVGFAGRVEVLEGPTGRRRWPDDVKARIVLESFDSGASVNEVARRHRISPQQLTGWRRAARQGRLALPLEDDSPGFVPVVVEDADAPAAEPASGATAEQASVIEIEMADLVLRLPAQSPPERIAAVVAALRLSA
ncbi:IS66-like element accessory protein TnpA [Chelativorans intermedius]|uniref:Transposase n=1 Tax=Chelativorans intermedius TaxID=515947 RepID=A0ABV6DDL9_9HYPH|nr:transposase [Chelativorans intermedius]MCT9000698.1 transposase [Chelativorans intermedius]